MKKIKFVIGALLLSASVFAQSSYDVMRLCESDVVGTAKFVGMGGAMSALGADISVMSSNPAGMGLYRSGDMAFSLSLNNNINKAIFPGATLKSDKTSLSVNNLGIVFANELDMGSLKFMNIAFNYRRSNSFQNIFELSGSLLDSDGNFFSQQYGLLDLYNMSGNYIDGNDYFSLDYPWLGLMASQTGLVDSDGNLLYAPTTNNNSFTGLAPTDMYYYSKEKGGVDDFDMNVSCNIDDMLYLGATITASNVDYTRYSEYSEYSNEYDFYTIQNRYNVSGKGIGVKLGAILRPFEYSPLRFGVAVHTPTWYTLTDRCVAAVVAPDGEIYDTRDYDLYGEELFVDYDFVTPWRFNLSAAYTFGGFMALNAEYEYVDCSTAKLEYTDGVEIYGLNEDIEMNMKGQHIFRAGALVNLDSNLSLRCGYNYISAPYEKDACKVNFMIQDTSTEFLNKYETNVYTVGLGYSGDNVYFDMAYKYAKQKADFYNYHDTEYVNPAVNVENERHNLVMTLGCRF